MGFPDKLPPPSPAAERGSLVVEILVTVVLYPFPFPFKSPNTTSLSRFTDLSDTPTEACPTAHSGSLYIRFWPLDLDLPIFFPLLSLFGFPQVFHRDQWKISEKQILTFQQNAGLDWTHIRHLTPAMCNASTKLPSNFMAPFPAHLWISLTAGAQEQNSVEHHWRRPSDMTTAHLSSLLIGFTHENFSSYPVVS